MEEFYKELIELDKKIREASALIDVTPIDRPEALQARTDELIALVKEQMKVLENKHEKLSEWAKSIQAQTEKLLS